MALVNLAGRKKKKRMNSNQSTQIGLASIVVMARGDRRQIHLIINKSALKEILLHHQEDFLDLKGIILKLSNSVKKMEKEER